MVTAPSTVPNFGALTLSFDDATKTFSVSPAAGFTLSPANYDPATESVGKTFTLTGTTAPALFEFSFTIAGSPVDGDTFSLQPTAQGVADNRNASLLGALQTAKLLFTAGSGATAAPTATLGNAYSQMVSSIGNKTREVQVNEATQASLLTQATDARDSLSGVNLDEEAANLVRYQQAYQAAGRVMSIAQRLFDEVLSIGR
jgi:flagellar hook-associated protein 1 FlgK